MPTRPRGAQRPGADLSCLRQYTRTGPREVRTRKSRVPSDRLRVPRGIGCRERKSKRSRKGSKRSQREDKREQKATKMEPKGSQRETKRMQKKQKGAKMEPKSDQNASQNRPSERVAKMIEKRASARKCFGPILGPKIVENV